MKIDKHGQVVNCWETAKDVHEKLKRGDHVALPLSVGYNTMTRFQIVFAPIEAPMDTYWNGIGTKGVMIAIERIGCYSLNMGNAPAEHSYMMEKWNLSLHDALALWPLWVGALEGRNAYEGWDVEAKMKEV